MGDSFHQGSRPYEQRQCSWTIIHFSLIANEQGLKLIIALTVNDQGAFVPEVLIIIILK